MATDGSFRDRAHELSEAGKQKDLEDIREWVFARLEALKKDSFGRDETDPNVAYLITKGGRVVTLTIGPVEDA